MQGAPDAFDDIEKTILNTYVGKPVEGTSLVEEPTNPTLLWCVSGLVSRTNNAAESVHKQLNGKVNGKLSVLKFLSIIEEEMERTNARIVDGCKPESRAIEQAKNELLAVELDKLLNCRQGVLCFLDNCGSVVPIRNEEDKKKFFPRVISSFDDIVWMLSNKASTIRAETSFIISSVLKVRWTVVMF